MATYYKGDGTTITIPSASSVDTAQLVDNAVTYNKLAEAVQDQLGTSTETEERLDDVEAQINELGDEINNVQNELNEYSDIFTSDVDESVQNWLDEHPEATTTVQDGSITESKLANSLKEKIENVFIDGIEVEEAFDSTSNTTYYLTTIPYFDDGTQNVWKVGIANDDNANLNTLESTLSFAVRKNTSVCINGGPFHLNDGTNVPYGVLIQDGTILQNVVSTLSGTNILGIKSDGSFVTFDATTTTAQTVLNAGCVNALVGYKTLIQDGSAIADSSVTVNPRQAICRKTNGDYLIFTCDGKTESDVGMTRSDVQRILLTKNVDFAFELDGGGSASTVVKYQKINKNIDSQYIDRKVENFLYMTKGIKKEDINDIYEIVSELRQNIVDALVNLEVYSGVIKLFAQSNEPNLEYYTNGNRTDRVGRIRLNSDGLNIKWTPAGGTETDLLTATSSYLRYLGVPFGNFMNYCTNTASSTDVNGLDKTGFYYATSDSTNTPKAGNFLVLHINLTETGSNKQQFAFPIAETNGYIYSRRMTTTNPTWTGWQPCGLFTSTTTNRPTSGLKNGTMYFDTTLNKPIWYNGGKWYDANGTQV